MIAGVLTLLLVALAADTAPAAQSPPNACTEWHGCRDLALAAAERGDYVAFHDLAWRAVQTGPARDPALMYLLARAQSLSGRPHDALVMLDRLAGMGVLVDAATNEDFARTRELPGWPEVQARLEGGTRPIDTAPSGRSVSAVKPAPASPAKPAAAPTPAAAATSATAANVPVPAAEALRFSSDRLSLGGLAYDGVSQRFLVGDRLGRKVMIVSEGSNGIVDLVRSDSAGFHDVSALEIDPKRGDLWVASDEAGSGSGALHRLQLISGRPLRTYPVAAEFQPVSLLDVAVSPAGAIFVLDSASRQILTLRAGGTDLERLMAIDLTDLLSLTLSEEEGIAYVSHGDAISRVDLRAKTAARLEAPKDTSFSRIERLRWYRRALIAVQVDADGSRRILRLELDGRGRRITRATTIGDSRPVAGKTFVALSGDELVFLEADPQQAESRPAADASSGAANFVAFRIRLR